MNVATGLLLARELGPHDRGVLLAVMLWPGLLATLAGLGVAEAVAYSVARRQERLGVITGSAVAIGLAQAAVVAAVAAAVVIPVALGDLSASERRPAFIFLAFVPLNALALYLMSILNGLQNFAWFQAIRSIGVVTTLAGLAALAAIGMLSVTAAVVTYVAANAVMLLLAGMRVRLLVREPLGLTRPALRMLLAYGARSHLGTVAGFLNTRLDQLVISVLLAPAKLGLYAVSVTLTSLTALVGSSVASVGLPALAFIEEDDRRRRAARDLVALTFLTSVLVTLPLLVFMPTIVHVLFGPAWSGAVVPARILLVAAVLLASAQALGAVLRALGRPLNAAYAELVALPVAAAGLALLLPAAGLAGAAGASVLAYATSAAWMVRRAGMLLDLRATEFVPRLGDLRQLIGLVDVRKRPPARIPEMTS